MSILARWSALGGSRAGVRAPPIRFRARRSICAREQNMSSAETTTCCVSILGHTLDIVNDVQFYDIRFTFAFAMVSLSLAEGIATRVCRAADE